MIKTAVMVLGLAGVFAVGTACFGLFGRTDPAARSKNEACAGLEGQAKIDCEQRQER